MKYILFAGIDHYPRGGMNDFIGLYDTLQEAQTAIIGLYPEGTKYTGILADVNDDNNGYPVDWANIGEYSTQDGCDQEVEFILQWGYEDPWHTERGKTWHAPKKIDPDEQRWINHGEEPRRAP